MDVDLFGNDEESDSDDDNLRGVSNVVYRQEYGFQWVAVICSPIQSVYSFTSDILGVGATGPIRTVINR